MLILIQSTEYLLFNNLLPFHSPQESKQAGLISCPIFHAHPHCESLWKNGATCLECMQNEGLQNLQ